MASVFTTTGRNVRRMGEKRAEKPDRRDLHREPEPVMITATLGNLLEVRSSK